MPYKRFSPPRDRFLVTQFWRFLPLRGLFQQPRLKTTTTPFGWLHCWITRLAEDQEQCVTFSQDCFCGVDSPSDRCCGAELSSDSQLYRRKRRFQSPSGVTLDRAGNLYGTASFGGQYGHGAVYKLSYRGGWIINPLYAFQGGEGGGNPQSRVVFGPDGSLYGTTVGGEAIVPVAAGPSSIVTPPPHVSGSIFSPWNETLIYRFHGPDGGYPTQGDLIFDSAGSIYGATSEGGDQLCNAPLGCGTAYQLVHSGQGWTETLLYVFHFASGGQEPMGGVVFDSTGNLYGTTSSSGMYGWGTVFQLTPSPVDAKYHLCVH